MALPAGQAEHSRWHTEDPPYGVPLAVLPGIWQVRLPLPFALDHINTWLLEDTPNSRVLVDSGIDSADNRHFWRQIFVQPLHLTRLLTTHCHPDHIGLSHWLLTRHDCEWLINETEWLTAMAYQQQIPGFSATALANFLQQHGLSATQAADIAERRNVYRQLVPTLTDTFTPLADGDVLTVGGECWRVITGQGHSPCHCSLYSEERRVLLAGDIMLPKISTNISVQPAMPLANPLAWFLASLQKLRALPEDTLVLPAHGSPFTGLHRRIAALEHHHAQQCARLLAVLDEPRQAVDVLPVLFQRQLDAHQWMFAMGEAVAHLNYLVGTGAVERITDTGHTHHFRQRNISS